MNLLLALMAVKGIEKKGIKEEESLYFHQFSMFADLNQTCKCWLRGSVLGTLETAKGLQINCNDSGEVVVKGEDVAQVSSAICAVHTFDFLRVNCLYA